jgi:hypothetical protein
MTIDAMALGHFVSRSTGMYCAWTGMYLHVPSTDVQLTFLMNSPYDLYVAGANTSEMGSAGWSVPPRATCMRVCRIWEYGCWSSKLKESGGGQRL